MPTLSDLWSAALDRLVRLHAVFGTPFAFLTACGELTRAEHGALLRHLRPLERLVRVALLFMALCEPAPAPARAMSRKPVSIRVATPSWPGEDSSAWRGVRFRVLSGRPRGRTSAHAGARAQVYARYPLATRMEAIARVIAAPDRWVRRLAALLRTQRNRVAGAIRRLSAAPTARPAISPRRQV
ncbi:MAG: hypothetical protein GC206_05965 [Alphaproteobacteria bacterium]|nr:hypothetical protein [Alphaproteobacteria bacterium]